MALFEGYGKVSSLKIERIPANNLSKGFGYICFDDIEAAKKAEDELDGKEIEGKVLTVNKFVKKAERAKQMKKQAEKGRKGAEAANNNL